MGKGGLVLREEMGVFGNICVNCWGFFKEEGYKVLFLGVVDVELS